MMCVVQSWCTALALHAPYHLIRAFLPLSPDRYDRHLQAAAQQAQALASPSIIPAVVSHKLRQGLEAQGGRADLLEWRLKQAEGRLNQQVGWLWGAVVCVEGGGQGAVSPTPCSGLSIR